MISLSHWERVGYWFVWYFRQRLETQSEPDRGSDRPSIQFYRISCRIFCCYLIECLAGRYRYPVLISSAYRTEFPLNEAEPGNEGLRIALNSDYARAGSFKTFA